MALPRAVGWPGSYYWLVVSLSGMGKAYSSTEVIKRLRADGWVLARTKGSHAHFTHPTKPGVVTVPHPKKDLPLGTVKSIEKQSGLKFT